MESKKEALRSLLFLFLHRGVYPYPNFSTFPAIIRACLRACALGWLA